MPLGVPSAIIASRTNDAGQNGVESDIEDLGATGDVWNDQSARKEFRGYESQGCRFSRPVNTRLATRDFFAQSLVDVSV